MATVQTTPQPFIPGARLEGGEALNTALAAPATSTWNSMVANGTTQAAGTQITANVSSFATVASGGVAILPKAVAGRRVTVYNYGANTLTLYPFETTTTIDTGAAGASTTLSAANRVAVFDCIAAGVWISFLGGAVSS
jgi:hypothetical protein